MMNIDTIIYAFRDAPVPPPFHRSYTIVVNNAHVSIEVDCYGEILHGAEFSITEERFEQLLTIIQAAELENTEKSGDIGACGGSSEELDLQCESETLFSGTVVHGQEGESTISGNFESVVGAIKQLIPNLAGLTAEEV